MNGSSRSVNKPTLLDLRERYGIGTVSLADKSGVESSIVYCMLLKRPVSLSEALQVLNGLSKLVGVNYVLSDVDVALSEK
jgi:hypothetical protein